MGYILYFSVASDILHPILSVNVINHINHIVDYILCFSVASDILHPVVRTHPVSGRRSIYVSDNFLERFDQMTVSVLMWIRSKKNQINISQTCSVSF